MTRAEVDRAAARIFADGPRRLREGAAPSRTRRETTFTESLPPGVGFREAAVQGNMITGVAVVTPTSVNGPPGGRRYTMSARRDGARDINERTVQGFLDHARGEPRSVRDLVGTFARGRVDGDGVVRADFKLLDTPVRPLLLDAAQEQPEALGLSIDAAGDAHVEGDVQIIEALSLRSVDVVATPASTSGLFEALRESRRGGRVRRPRRSLDDDIWTASWRLFV